MCLVFFSQWRRSLSKHNCVVPKNVYPERHSLFFGHSEFYRLIFLLKTKVSNSTHHKQSTEGLNMYCNDSITAWIAAYVASMHPHYSIHNVYRRVHTMKVMCIESESIRIVCVHTECALTGGLKPVWKWIASWREIIRVLHFRAWSVVWRNKRSDKKWQVLLCCFA